MKLSAVLFLIILFGMTSCQPPKPLHWVPPTSNAFLITPGKSVGVVRLNAPMDSVKMLLGQPDSTAMVVGKKMALWYLKSDSTNGIFTVFATTDTSSRGQQLRVSKIQVSDSLYRTSQGVSTGKLLVDIARIFVIRPIDTFTKAKAFYTVFGTQKGMSFAVDSAGFCRTITILNPDSESTAYLPFH